MEAAKKGTMDDLKQSLLENLADWLDSEWVKFELGYIGLKETDDCHIKMTEAAFEKFIEGLKPSLP